MIIGALRNRSCDISKLARRRMASGPGGHQMGRTEIAAMENGGIGEASGDMFFRLGMMYSIGSDVPTDYVSAHKWFNLAAMRGNAEAARLRREIAVQMTEV